MRITCGHGVLVMLQSPQAAALYFEHPTMDVTTLVDVRITYAYQNDRDGLQTFSMPVMLMPACNNVVRNPPGVALKRFQSSCPHGAAADE